VLSRPQRELEQNRLRDMSFDLGVIGLCYARKYLLVCRVCQKSLPVFERSYNEIHKGYRISTGSTSGHVDMA
jgi:hypothetical protein